LSATWIEVALPNAKAVFSTRLGGVSGGPYAELNLGILTDDDPALVRRNRELLATALGRDPGAFAMGRQVHGTGVQVHAEAPSELAEADAQVTTSPDLTSLVLVADCVPLVLATARAVAAVHCGWRGVAGGIVTASLDAVRAQGDGGEVTAAIGPGIGPCCYEVGEEVADAFRSGGLGDALDEDRLDLAAAIRLELDRKGVQVVTAVGLCTSCNRDLFFSHRRDGGVTGRQAGLGWLSP
jgi:purine-nucleoside/S-methyl-5'-thioadenosine phosphorylase / adenosine deaminase